MIAFEGDDISRSLRRLRADRGRDELRCGTARLHLESLPSGGAVWTVWAGEVLAEGVWVQREVHERIDRPSRFVVDRYSVS